MVHPNKKQKVGDNTTYKEEVLFNSDILSKIISYLPSVDVLNLALTSKRFGISNIDDGLSLIEKSVHIAILDIATEEQLAALPHYDGESSLADYHYLQLLREPLIFDQLIGTKYVNSEDKAFVRKVNYGEWGTAISDNVLRAGKHYATFVCNTEIIGLLMGVMRPGHANQYANQRGPLHPVFYNHYTRRLGQEDNNNDIQCCMYNGYDGFCHSSDWRASSNSTSTTTRLNWEGSENMYSDIIEPIGMLLDLDEGTLSVYKNGRKLGIMKRGLAGPYCWVVSLYRETQVSIKRGTIPPS